MYVSYIYMTYVTQTYLKMSTSQQPIIGWDDELTLSRWQLVIWTNGGLVYRHICASLGFLEKFPGWNLHQIPYGNK